MISSPARTGLLLALICLILDQVTKIAALETLFTDGLPVRVTGFFNLVAVWNRGVSFGMLSDFGDYGPYILSGFAILVTVALLVWLIRAETLMLACGLGLVVGGAIGNVIDRLRLGAVVDFLDVHVAGYHWPAFNIADSGITIGVAFLLWDGFRPQKTDTPDEDKSADDGKPANDGKPEGTDRTS